VVELDGRRVSRVKVTQVQRSVEDGDADESADGHATQ